MPAATCLRMSQQAGAASRAQQPLPLPPSAEPLSALQHYSAEPETRSRHCCRARGKREPDHATPFAQAVPIQRTQAKAPPEGMPSACPSSDTPACMRRGLAGTCRPLFRIRSKGRCVLPACSQSCMRSCDKTCTPNDKPFMTIISSSPPASYISSDVEMDATLSLSSTTMTASAIKRPLSL